MTPEAEKKARLRRGSKLRPINKGNIYDVSGKLRKLVHEIESGKLGEVTDIIAAIRCIGDKKTQIQTIFLGTNQPEVLHYMASRLEKETN